jgi:UDP-N-acetylmuramoyl-tripeptide--D-alanyl-D-alanine ligase
MSLSAGIRRSTYGSSARADLSGAITANDPFLNIAWKRDQQQGEIRSKLFGEYNFENIMAAVCIGNYFGIAPEKTGEVISAYQPGNNRSQMTETSRNILILDSYNANPSSMKAALENFSRVAGKPRMVILGDMMELGEHSLSEHTEILAQIRELQFNKVFLVGEFFSRAAAGGPEKCFRDTGEAEEYFHHEPISGCKILLKGSRKMQLEKLIPLL